jgi:diguanylate cyclase (GGDEF)-like protein
MFVALKKLFIWENEADVDQDHSQAVVRVAILTLCWLYLIAGYYLSDWHQGPYAAEILILATGYSLYAVLWFLAIRRIPKHDSPYLRGLNIVLDLAMVFAGLYLLDDYGVVLFPLLLWIIMGNGLRFGLEYLGFAHLVGVGGFISIVLFSAFWRDHPEMSVAVMLALLALPVLYGVQTNRLNRLNERLQDELAHARHAAQHDGLTDLPNRAQFTERLQLEVKRSHRTGESFALMYVDLDGFKRVNDTLGHQFGDDLLVAFSKRIKEIVRETDLAARVGGDEFAIILPTIDTPEGIDHFAERLKLAIREPYEIQGRDTCLNASIGTALFPDDARDMDDLIRVADRRMYEDKSRRLHAMADNVHPLFLFSI